MMSTVKKAVYSKATVGRERHLGGNGELLLRFLVIALILMLAAMVAARSQSIFSGTQLRDAVQRYVENNAGEDAEVSLLGAVAEQKFDDDGVTAHCSGDVRSLRGQSSVALEFLLGGRVIRRVSVPVYVKISRTVPVAAEPLQQGTVLSEEKIYYQKKDISSYNNNEIPEEDEVSGATLRRTLSAGTIITRSALVAVGGVRKGGVVSLRVIAGGVVLTTPGVALNDASPGETVRVTRNGSTNVYSGTLAEDSAVEIFVRK